MITKVPEKVIVTCDFCGVECNNINRRQSGILCVYRDLLDMQGSACADGSYKREMCDQCLVKVTDAIRTAVEGKKK